MTERTEKTALEVRGAIELEAEALTQSASPTSELEELEAGTTVSRYVILEKLGEGGMGMVYKAYDPELDRSIALKLVKSSARKNAETSSAARIESENLREAQALAKLAHPNVVAVHDVGLFNHHLFMAMEYVPGKTLQTWLSEDKPSRREILDVLLAAGRGLVAAHRAGLVHRDFKPQNIILGDDGRVRVLDFGLAEIQQRPSESPTQPNGLAGTPAYMAPEQFLGLPVDHRTDQFSFAIVLHEALYGVRPFASKDAITLRDAVVQGQVREPPPDTAVPPRLRRIILRGLLSRQEDRYPSLEELLADLQRDPRKAWHRAFMVAGVLLLGLGTALGVWKTIAESRALCRGGRDKLRGVWDEDTRAAIEAAFLATGKPFAAKTWSSVDEALSKASEAWVLGYQDACEATRVRGEQSEELLDLRMGCLGEWLQELGALTRVFRRADAGVLGKAVDAAYGLGDFARCADTTSLLEHNFRDKPPRDKQTLMEMENTRTLLAETNAYQQTGKYPDGIKTAQAALEKARELKQKPLIAKALLALGLIQEKLGERPAALGTLRKASLLAEATGQDEIKARAMLNEMFVLGFVTNPGMDWRQLSQMASATIRRQGNPDNLRGTWHNSKGILLDSEGRFEEALHHLKKALALREQELGADHPVVATSLNNLGALLWRLERSDEAQTQIQRALDIKVKKLGPEHPSTLHSFTNLGLILLQKGDRGSARGVFERTLDGWNRAVGPDHPSAAWCIVGLAQIQQAAHDLVGAQTLYEQTLDLCAKKACPAELLPLAQSKLAGLLWGQGILRDRACDLARSALAVYSRIPARQKEFTLLQVELQRASCRAPTEKLPLPLSR